MIDVWPGLDNFVLATPGLPEGDQRERYRLRKAKHRQLLEHQLKGLNTPAVVAVPIGLVSLPVTPRRSPKSCVRHAEYGPSSESEPDFLFER